MTTKIIPKKSSVSDKVPLATDLEVGEIAINLTDKKIYSKNSSNAVVELGGAASAGSPFDQELNTTDDVSFNSVQLTGGTGDQGTLSWNTDEETLDLVINGSVIHLGQDLLYHVRNNTASTIPKGTIVRATGTLGASGRITVAPMIANGTVPAKFILGITTEDIVADSDGKVAHFGKIREVDTTGFNQGDVLYVSPTTAGELTATEPSRPNLALPIAIVISSAISGTLFVRIHDKDDNEYQPFDADIVSDANYVHTDNNYTTTEKNKLAGIESGATGDQTAAEIRALVEAATDSNVFTDADHSKLNGIESGAQVNVATNLGYSTAASTGTVTSSTGSNATIPAATTSAAGLLTSSDKTKLNGIATGAQVNVATNLTYSTAATTGTVNSSTGTNATIPAATTSLAGLMTNTDKSKLDGIAAGAQVNVGTNLGQSRNATSYTVTSSTGSNTTLAAATTTNAGVFVAADKSKLDGIAAGAQVNVGTNLGSSGTGATRTITSSTGTNTSITYSAADVGAAAASHTHAISDVTGLQGALDGKLSTSGKAADSNLLDGIDSSAFLRSDTSDTLTSGVLTINGSTSSEGALDIVNGRLKVGRHTAGSGIWYNGAGTDQTWFSGLESDSATASYRWYFGSDRMTLTTSGSLTVTGDVNSNSDERLKTNWQPLQQDYLQKLSQVKYGTYDRIDTELTQAGISAQDLQKVLPEAVSSDSEGTLSVNYGNSAMVSVIELTKLVLKQQEQILKQQQQINELQRLVKGDDNGD